MLDELHSLSEHGVFEVCELPAGCRPLPAKWVLKIKRGAQGEIERFKARYVAKGFAQVYGFNFFETWAPVGRYATLRALLSIWVVWDLETKHIDIKSAFLNGVLHQDIYIVQPPMFHDGTRRVWKLKSALYGLTQAAREWHKALVELLSELGFDRCHSNTALFVSGVGKYFIFLWVDEFLIFSEKKLLQPVVDRTLATFEGRDLKELHHVLGMEVKRDRKAKTLSISHKQMITGLLADSIQYIAVVAQPEIAYAAHTLARHMAGSATKHWLAVEHVMRYLQSTIDVVLTFIGSRNESVVDVYSDASRL